VNRFLLARGTIVASPKAAKLISDNYISP